MKKVLYIFGQLNDNDIEWLINNGKKENVKKGTVLIHKGEAIDRIFIVLDGLFNVVLPLKKSEKLITQLESGEIIGEMSFVDSILPFATITASQNSTVYSINKNILTNKINTDTGFGFRFFRAISIFLADRLRATTGLLGYGSKEDIKEYMNEIDELNSLIIDNVSLAGDRFHHMLIRMMEK